ncbi:MAG: hypothetical protein HZC41_06435 [Chloroflexi bacterium]|nr:hypothetical protein [Chloroflexota bacterium]
MMRRLLFGALLLTAGLATAISGLRLLPVDRRAISAFLLPPPGCPAPCWFGIRPKITSAADALRLLLAHPWTANVESVINFSRADGWLNWQWAEQPPDAPVAPANNTVRIDYNTVTSIRLATRIRLGELWLLLGVPDDVRRMQYGDRVYLDLVYRDQSLLVQVELPCGAPARALWSAPVTLLWLTDLPAAFAPAAFSLMGLTRCGGGGSLP